MGKSLPETPVWTDKIFQLETDTPVLGGPNGPDNWQAQQLANRSQFLKNEVLALKDGRETTFYISESDPDGTIAGLAGTLEGGGFRVAQGFGRNPSFIYYRKISGAAVPESDLPGSTAVIKNTAASLINEGGLTSVSGTRDIKPVSVEPGIYRLSTGYPEDTEIKEVRTLDFIYLNEGDRIAVPHYYNVAGVCYDTPNSTTYNGNYFTYARDYIAETSCFVRFVFKYVGSDESVDPRESDIFDSLTIIRNVKTLLLNVPNGSLSANMLNLEEFQTNFFIEPGSIHSGDGMEQPPTPTFVQRTRMIPASHGDKYMIIDPVYVFCPFYYSKAGAFISSPGVWLSGELTIPNDGFVRFTTKRADDGENINKLQFAAWIQGPSAISRITLNIGALPENSIPVSKLKSGDVRTGFPITEGSLNSGNGSELPPTTTFVHRTGLIPISVGESVYLTSDDYYYCPFYYSKSGAFISSDGAWHSDVIVSQIDGNVRFSTKRRDNSNEISEHDAASWIAIGSPAIITEPSQIGADVVGERSLSQSLRVKVNSLAAGQWLNCLWFSIGDSITERGWYQPLVVDSLGLASFVNYGVGGTCIARTSPSDTTAMSVRYKNITGNPDLITVFGGVNDFGYSYGSNGGTALGTFGDSTEDTFYGALRVLIEGLVTKFPDAKLAFVITTPVSLSMGMKSPNAKGFYLADYCRAVREMCSEYSIPYLDLQKTSGFNQKNISIMTSNFEGTASDGLHPSRKGMEWIATKLSAFLNGI